MKNSLCTFLCLSLAIALVLPACKKDKEVVSFSGFVQDPNSGQFISGATVTLQASGVSSGVFNAGYSTIAELTTGSDGSFVFDIEESSYASYRITIFKQHYFVNTVEISASNVTPESPYQGTLSLFSEGFIRLHVVNGNPHDNTDMISLFYNNPPVSCADCCSNDVYQFIGEFTDTLLRCKTHANRDLILVASIFRDNITTVKIDTIAVPAFDTVDVDLIY